MNSGPYYFVRYAWARHADVEGLAKDLKESFEVVPLHRGDPGPIAVTGQDTLEKFHIRADTLHAYLSPTRATLFQKERAPFTKRDLKLREKIFAIYLHSRETPLPWGFAQEPRFEVEQK